MAMNDRVRRAAVVTPSVLALINSLAPANPAMAQNSGNAFLYCLNGNVWAPCTSLNPLNVTGIGGGGGGTVVQGNAGTSTQPWYMQMVALGTTVSSTNPFFIDAASNSEIVSAINAGVGNVASTVPTDAVQLGANAIITEPAAVTAGTLVVPSVGVEGKLIVLPHANKENFERASASTTATTAVTLLGPAGAGLKNYITDVQCFRIDAGSNNAYVTFNDTGTTVMGLPSNGGFGGGNNFHLAVPLVGAANATFTFSVSTAISTVFCNVQGYKGS